MIHSMYHCPVMLAECIDGLAIDSEGTYIDVTFGSGGHSLGILEKLKGGRLISFDQDTDAKDEAKKITHRSFTFCDGNFRYLKQFLKLHNVSRVQGVIADLGVSSHQIDSPNRGFSTRQSGPLDMRMNKGTKITASKILNEYSATDLHQIFEKYGEVRNAKILAAAIVDERLTKPFETTSDLTHILKKWTQRGKENKYFAQVFQSLRIVVNDELSALEEFLNQCSDVIDMGGRLAVLSYHSLEDRMIKNYIKTGNVKGEVNKDFYGHVICPFTAILRKPQRATPQEVSINNRSRSAKLRVAKRNEV